MKSCDLLKLAFILLSLTNTLVLSQELQRLISFTSCRYDADCHPNSFCFGNDDVNGGKCRCKENYILIDRNRTYYECIPGADGIGFSCKRDIQCQINLGVYASCSELDDGVCRCRDDAHLGTDRKCHKTAALGELCETDNNCLLRDGTYGYCVVGKCVCNLNHYPSEDGQRCILSIPLGKSCPNSESCNHTFADCHGGICKCLAGYIESDDNLVCLNVTEKKFSPNKSNISKLESVDRILNIPVVESGWNYAGQVYGRLKQSSNVLHWAFGQAESSITTVLSTTLPPTIILFQGPISTLDKIVCQSLDVVEQKVPSIILPPEKIYQNTKEYVNDVGSRIVRPILKRADSVKQIGNSVLDNKYTAFAADTLDGALTVADKYVDRYLPADKSDAEIEKIDASRAAQESTRKALKTIQHMDQLSRKLQRRLTRRTLAEAKALKEHSTEAIHVLVYIVDLIANDPKLALQKSQELWASLSSNEPENQARPDNLEELIVMITRESARRVVHFVNFTSAVVNQLPDHLKIISNRCLHKIDDFFKTGRLENINHSIYESARFRAHKFTLLLHQLNLYTTDLLENVAKSLEQHEQNIKNSPSVSKPLVPLPRDNLRPPTSTNQFRTTHRYPNLANGVENSNM